ncbi:ASKHA domain-containing protein [Paludicola sp. MB14-C6]|uniref:ASKHA domain-containing protein n=1 Tax=Paludihabitans sp. MB14-C6 TaxID=3070656 RepID=UPI0027DEA214|nr:ASKHA domain-containing protein [Paludicola sp. MB14-C6]WMJ22582.1 ASKHA domain-containing protein [Paludicola sp. MB14-C6]
MKLTIQKENSVTEIITDGNKSILKLLQENHIYIDAPCNANGKCGKCKVQVNGQVTPITAEEQKLLSLQEQMNDIRLACLTKPIGDCSITILNQQNYTVQESGMKSDFVISPRAKDSTKAAIGLAVDIGTTTVACYFYDLNSGKRLDTVSGLNEQRSFGADVISRINSCIEKDDGKQLLKQTIVKQLNNAIDSFCSKKSYSYHDIMDITIAGNTVMLHLLTGYDASGIAVAPFTPTSLFGFDLNAKEIGITTNDTAKVFLTDCVSGYVGGDITVGVLSAKVHEEKENCIYIDIGTNGEMAIGNQNGFICCATAAGPAFEGATIQCGVGGITGAISKVTIKNNDIKIETIGNQPAIGICGSGLVDTIACLLKLGVIDETGRIDEDEIPTSLLYRYREEDEPVFVLDIDNNIYLTQKDIREVQLAKAAICAGIQTLIHAKGLTEQDIHKVILAGGFGSYIDKKSACEIGLLPPSLLDKITTVVMLPVWVLLKFC